MKSLGPEIGLELNEENINDLKSLIDKSIETTSFAKGRDKARSETWKYMEEGTKRAVDFIMDKYTEVVSDNSSINSKQD